MTALELLNACVEKDIHLWTEGSRIRFRAPQGALTADLRDRIAGCKKELIEHLNGRAAGTKTTFRLSYGQKAIWFIQQTIPESSAYNLSLVFRIRSVTDAAAMRNALQAVIDRHSVLRTRYRVQNGEPVQDVFGFEKVRFVETDVSGLSEEALCETVTELHRRPFDLENGPILRADLLTRSQIDHILLITLHHIATDGWSSWTFLEELRQFYDAEVNNRPIALPLPEKEYHDFLQAEQQLLSGAQSEELASFWRSQLDGDLPVIALPFDHPRPKVQTLKGASTFFRLDKQLSIQLRELSKSQSSTLYMILLAVFFILLHKYTQQEDIIIGSPTFGRNKPEFDRSMGFFINQVPIRARVCADAAFTAFLAQVRKTSLEVLAHQDYPFHLMAGRFWQNTDRSIPPLCQVEFILQKPHKSKDLLTLLSSNAGGTADFGGLKIEYFPLAQQEGQLDLTLEMVESDGELFGHFKYSTDLFDSATILGMVGHFKNLLASIVRKPDQTLDTLEILSPAEQRRIVAEWNATGLDFGGPGCIHRQIEAQADRAPHGIAVSWDDRHLAYAELNRRANQLARHLKTLGAGPGVIVGVCLERSFDMIVALIAVLKAGAAYLPLDPSYPAERLSFMMEDARLRIVLTKSPQMEHLPDTAVPSVCMDTDGKIIASHPTHNFSEAAAEDQLAYVIYTSGSTGTPKGVMISHRALANFVQSAGREYGITASDKVLQFASINFDASAEEIYPCLAQGANLVLRTDAMLDSMAVFLSRCRDWGITVLDLPTAFWVELTLALRQGALRLPESVRLVIIGGEQAHPGTLAVWQACVPASVRLLNTYGPTEATVVATVCDLCAYPKAPGEMPAVPIGRPIANVQAYILDQHMQPVPVGVIGELHLGGAGLAGGYLFRPDLTAQKFVPNPFSDAVQARLYKTGDLARYLPDGQIEYKGRTDAQVKIRGFRVEPGEIESVLLKHPGVTSAHVTIRATGNGRSVLAAYVATDLDHAAAPDQLRDHLKRRLPDWMLPSVLIPVDRLPRTPGGKIDAGALPQPSAVPPGGREAFVAPRTPVELKLAEMWSEILNVPEIGVTQDFFSIGGHSLMVLRVISNIGKEWNVALPFRQFFETPTIAELAQSIEALIYLAEGSRTAPAPDAAREEVEI